ncbi:MAG: hypothetical protein ACODAJ_14190 [Planctomycetota bacterium]
MRVLAAAALVAAAIGIAGCGGQKKPQVDTQPFADAIVEYCRVNSMGMKPDSFESVEVEDGKAVAEVRMAVADDSYGLKPLWTITFRKEGDAWAVTSVER